MTDGRGAMDEEVRRVWNHNAAYWDARMGEGNDFVNLLIWPATERLLAPAPGMHLLDVACGNGLGARRLAAMGAHVVAVDVAEEMIRHARARATPGETVDYQVLDCTDEAALVALGKHRFDGALCSMALFDMPQINPLFRALRRLLKPAAPFVFSITHPAFNQAFAVRTAFHEMRDGEVQTTYAVQVSRYMTPSVTRGVALSGQPVQQPYFDRPLQLILEGAFAAGLVLDGLEERAFPPEHHPRPEAPLHWSGRYSEIPAVLVARLRTPADAGQNG